MGESKAFTIGFSARAAVALTGFVSIALSCDGRCDRRRVEEQLWTLVTQCDEREAEWHLPSKTQFGDGIARTDRYWVFLVCLHGVHRGKVQCYGRMTSLLANRHECSPQLSLVQQ